MRNSEIISVIENVLSAEAQAILYIKERVSEEYIEAVRLLVNCSGKIITVGVGKSGHIAKKIAATFASTGSPAFFVHADEAVHGDLGMITKSDVIVAFSNSGETSELLSLIPSIKRQGIPYIAITGNKTSTLAKHATVVLHAHIDREACPLNLAPTSSTTVALAVGDALAVACMSEKGFTKTDFAKTHPGGSLGKRLLTYVSDVMRTAPDIPIISEKATVLDAIHAITSKHMGMTCVVNSNDQLTGIFTEGDLGRVIESRGDVRNLNICHVMTADPITIDASKLAIEAFYTLREKKINQVIVCDENKKIIGAIHIHDLINGKLISR